MIVRSTVQLALAVAVCVCTATDSQATPQQPQQPAASVNTSTSSPTPAATPTAPSLPEDYVIGADDLLTIIFWREKDLSGDVAVRPDGRISLPLINEIEAAGLTPEQLRFRVTEAA